MDIIVPFSIRKRELNGIVSDEAKKIFEKIKNSPQLATIISAKGLPPRTTLHKVYSTTPEGARRLLFFCRHAPLRLSPAKSERGKKKLAPLAVQLPPERWVLLFYRNKGDAVGDNMSHKNPDFEGQLGRNLVEAIKDLQADTYQAPRCESF
jgi:hypothetical protein